MSIKLYEYNLTAYNMAVRMLEEEGKAAVIHPTGTGKSFIAFKLCEDNPTARVAWVSPSEYIYKTQRDNLIAAGFKPSENITFITYAKLAVMSDNEIAALKADYIILDEFHRGGAEQWGKGVERLIAAYPDAPILGLSATNIRYLDNQRDMAEELFDGCIASKMTLGEAIARGILLAPTYITALYSCRKELERYEKRVKSIKGRAARESAVKYLEALRRSLDKADGLDVIFKKYMADRKGKYIVFCPDYESMQLFKSRAKEMFAGVDRAPKIYSVYSEDVSSDAEFRAFKSDESEHLKLLYSIDMLNEGVHVEDISGVILFRPTVSPIIYKQQIGRALSANKCKQPIIFDIVNNFENLYSISALRQEMDEAVRYYRANGKGDRIVSESFTLIDEVRDCRRLFNELNGALSAGWELMYSYAKQYYSDHGNLEVPKRYKTPEGYSLGLWIQTQRRVRAGEQYGTLSQERIDKLDSIGMVWDSFKDYSFNRYYAAAREYYAVHGDLMPSADYVSADGVKLGTWISRIRGYKKSGMESAYLTPERIEQLEAIGMRWSKFDFVWEKNYAELKAYHARTGNSAVPSAYVTESGVRLGVWVRRIRGMKNVLTKEQLSALEAVDMDWQNRSSRAWSRMVDEIKIYAAAHGNLEVPVAYVSASGYRLGSCMARLRCSEKKFSPARREELASLGVRFNEDSWEKRYALAKKYYSQNGNLSVPADYIEDGIWLGKWLNEQKQIYRGNRNGKFLTAEQIERLEEIGMFWSDSKDMAWERNFVAVKEYVERHGTVRIPADCVRNGVNLAGWLKRQRKHYARGALERVKIERLRSIGISLEPKRRRTASAKPKTAENIIPKRQSAGQTARL